MPTGDAADGGGPLVQALDVTVSAGGQVILPPISLTAVAGETVCVTGPNGSGKTTLLRVLAGLLKAHGGAVLMDGAIPDLRRPSFRQSVSRLLSPVPFSFRLTVAEHLRLVATTWGATPAGAAEQTDACLVELLAADLAGRFPHQLSAGEAQAASLGVALLRPCRVLLLDEPEQSLDTARVAALAGAFRRVAAGGATVVAATHSAALVEALDARVVPLARATP